MATLLYTGIIFSHRRQTVGMDMWPRSSHLDVYLDSLSLLIADIRDTHLLSRSVFFKLLSLVCMCDF